MGKVIESRNLDGYFIEINGVLIGIHFDHYKIYEYDDSSRSFMAYDKQNMPIVSAMIKGDVNIDFDGKHYSLKIDIDETESNNNYVPEPAQS